MSYLSLLVLFLSVFILTDIARNPKHQIHAQPNSGLVDYQPPAADQAASFISPSPSPSPPHGSGYNGHGGGYHRPSIGYSRFPPHINPRRPVRPPP
ncbi:hypothetical protein MtrunA17_Chr6g0467871 [Medicago truncatula]|uniref:Leguminosin proline-rich group669 secreted peptide n=1 Tax=Medicago truncatula TaxID=3880 RepID=A0A072UK10_MEDTR|nr:leguminosin proline-rich group669 secreted peptide [Medicago truncatula]RHN51374.1 hypothetical protein MtrunA17_Chr6g0467871 [Medicago truncatula]